MTTLYTPRIDSLPGLAETAGHAGQVLQLKRHVLEDVPRPGTIPQPLEEATPLTDAAAMLHQTGEHRSEPLIETGDDVGRAIFQVVDIDPRLKDGTVGPDVRTPQMEHVQEFDRFVGHGQGGGSDELGSGTVKQKLNFRLTR
jgi:hypothetical protein